MTDNPLPCDVEPEYGPSYYLTLPCRTFAQAVRDVSKRRDLPDWVWPLLREMRELRPSAEVVSLADVRRGLLVRNAGRGV